MSNETHHGALELNVSAPIFKVTDIFGRTVDLEEYRGTKTFIGFFRHVGCPFCNLRINYLTKRNEEWKDRMRMIFFFESRETRLQQSPYHQEVNPIPLVADPDNIWYETYGIEKSASKSRMAHLTTFIQTAVKAKLKGLPMYTPKDGESYNTIPAEFLLDEDLIIRRLYYAKGLTDRMKEDHILEFINQK